MKDILIKGDWFKGYENAPEEFFTQLTNFIIRYKWFNEEIDTSNCSWELSGKWQEIKGHLDRMDAAREKKVEFGKNHGRQIDNSAFDIWYACREFEEHGIKYGAKDIAQKCGLEPRSAKREFGFIYDSPGWKNRKDADWGKGAKRSEKSEKFSENSEKNSEKSEKNSENSYKFSEKSDKYMPTFLDF